MTRIRRPPQFTIGQLTVVIAVIGVILALVRIGLGAVVIVIGCLVLMHRSRLPYGAPERAIGCLGAVVGFLGASVLGMVLPGLIGLPTYGVAAAVVVSGTIIGYLAGRFIALALYHRRARDAKQRRLEASDPVAFRRKQLLAECKLVEQLMAQAEKDGDDETRTKLAAYRAKLGEGLAL
jgi:uncharacterized membrane protein YhaH (DUF805 family)